MMTRGGSVLFNGKVEKIGTDGSRLTRNVFVTPSSLLVCLPAGGVTRTIPLSSIMDLKLERQSIDEKPRCTVHVRNEAVLTLSFSSREEIDRFVDAVSRATDEMCNVHFVDEKVREKHLSLNNHSSTSKGVRFVEPADLRQSPPSANSTKDSRHRLPSPASVGRLNSYDIAAPVEPLENMESTLKTKREVKSEGVQMDGLSLPIEKHISPLRSDVMGHYGMGSLDGFNTPGRAKGISHAADASLYTSNHVRPIMLHSNVSSGQTFQLQKPSEQTRESVHEFSTQCDAFMNLQQRLSTELEFREQTVNRLNRELQEKNAFIDDLKTALRSQEGVFQEMLKATDKLRLIEVGKCKLEKQVELLEAEVRRLEELIKEKEVSYQQELASKLAQLHETHKVEVDAVQKGFEEYDVQMTEYVNSLLKDREREASKWGEKERLLQKQIESQKQEIDELKKSFASRRVPPFTSSSTADNDDVAQCDKRAGSALNAETDCSDKNRAVLTLHHESGTPRLSCWTPPALKTPALGIRLASLEEEHARLCLHGKLQRYVKGQGQGQLSYGVSSDGIDGREKEQRSNLVTFENLNGVSSYYTRVPYVEDKKEDRVQSLLYTPSGSLTVRNSAIL